MEPLKTISLDRIRKNRVLVVTDLVTWAAGESKVAGKVGLLDTRTSWNIFISLFALQTCFTSREANDLQGFTTHGSSNENAEMPKGTMSEMN